MTPLFESCMICFARMLQAHCWPVIARLLAQEDYTDNSLPAGRQHAAALGGHARACGDLQPAAPVWG